MNQPCGARAAGWFPSKAVATGQQRRGDEIEKRNGERTGVAAERLEALTKVRGREGCPKEKEKKTGERVVRGRFVQVKSWAKEKWPA
jgi:hypothetical protein